VKFCFRKVNRRVMETPLSRIRLALLGGRRMQDKGKEMVRRVLKVEGQSLIRGGDQRRGEKKGTTTSLLHEQATGKKGKWNPTLI